MTTGTDQVYTGGDSLAAAEPPSWFGPPSAPVLDRGPEERLRAAVPGNRLQNGWRGVGGKLFVTTDRLAFRPHRFDALLGGRGVTIPVDAIADASVRPATRSVGSRLRRPLAALLGVLGADRLRVERSDGSAEEFVVGDPAALVEVLDGLR